MDLAELKLLADQHGIRQKSPLDDWPLAQKPTFQGIQDLGQTSFRAYSNSINGESDSEPWKRKNKARARWLAQHAGRLSVSCANESTWRMHIENVILERFSVEVACPTCKHRLWRSEIESPNTGSKRKCAELDDRRDKRQLCKCPPKHRPQDRYEMGTSRLFDDRCEELVVHSTSLGALPNQRPDRIVGLSETNNINELLEQPPQPHSADSVRKVRDLVLCSPFKPQSSPLLFPFLVLEAKSDSAQSSFSDIQTQSAFPIWSLLNLQHGLQTVRAGDTGRPEPLVWLLGYRGSDWKVYGCYLGSNAQSELTYNIHYLRSGDITTEDGALQLILLIDFIVDWARDTFRPSIIAQLKAVATGKAFDEVTLVPDSDIASMSREWEWMTHAPTTIVQEDEPEAGPSGTNHMDRRNHTDTTSMNIPHTRFGAVRLFTNTTFELTGLRITEDNVESILAMSVKPYDFYPRDILGTFKEPARKLVRWITSWDEMLLIIGDDLDYIERRWNNEDRWTTQPFEEGPGTEFHAIFEYRCFMTASWDVVKELSYVAVSKPAFRLLEHYAGFRRHPNIERFRQIQRPCPSPVLKDGLDCLRSGSPWQVLCSAISSTLLTIYPNPERKRADHVPPVFSLGIGYINAPRVRTFIDHYITLVERPVQKRRRREGPWDFNREATREQINSWEETTANRSYLRMSQHAVPNSQVPHDGNECTRCKSSDDDLYAFKNWKESTGTLTAYGAILIASLEDEHENGSERQHQQRHDFNLFVLEEPSWLEDALAVSTVVEDLVQNEIIYHTILHGPVKKMIGSQAIVWNLPLPYRRHSKLEQQDLERWITELKGQPTSNPSIPNDMLRPWEYQQMLLEFLRAGHTHDSAEDLLFDYCGIESRDGAGASIVLISLTSFWRNQRPRSPFPPRSDEPFWVPETLKLCGE